MSLLELFEFTLKFNQAAPATATWIYMLLIAVLMVLGFGWVWRIDRPQAEGRSASILTCRPTTLNHAQ